MSIANLKFFLKNFDIVKITNYLFTDRQINDNILIPGKGILRLRG